MALQHGSVWKFDHAAEDWETYVERVDLYLTANGITAAGQKRAVLLSVSHISQDKGPGRTNKPAELRYDDIVKLVQTHYDPKRGVAVHRFRFNSRSRQQGEKVAEYVDTWLSMETRWMICCATGLHVASTTLPFSAGYSQSLILTSRKRSKSPNLWRWQTRMPSSYAGKRLRPCSREKLCTSPNPDKHPATRVGLGKTNQPPTCLLTTVTGVVVDTGVFVDTSTLCVMLVGKRVT